MADPGEFPRVVGRGEDGMRRRRSGEQADDGIELPSYNRLHNATRTLSADDAPLTLTTGSDVASNARRASEDDARRLRQPDVTLERKRSLVAGKKRKSDEITRNTSGTRERPATALSIDTRVASGNSVTGAPLMGSPTSMRSPPGQSSQRLSPVTPRSRNRGMSLRTAIFARNLDRRSVTGDSIVEMSPVATSGRENNTSSGVKKSHSFPSVTISPIVERTMYTQADRPPPTHGFQGIAALPNYQRWVEKQANRHLPIKRIKDGFRKTRKFVLRIQEIPPSKDGRHIPLDPSRKKALIDERTGHPYISNFVRSSKYTPWNFIPRQLFAQFSKLANFYFLCVSTLQMIPGLSTTGTYTTIIPLLFFVSISMGKEGYEDFRRHRLDEFENNRYARVLHAYRPVDMAARNDEQRDGDLEEQNHGHVHWAQVKWQSLQVGDVVKLERDEAAPADIMLLSSNGDNNIAYIETMALDGETNLKAKQPSAVLNGHFLDPEAIASAPDMQVIVEDPNLDLYNFEGRINVNGSGPAPLTNNEIIYRGSVLRNTPEAIGMVIYSGEECKIRMNANKNPRIKAPSLQATVNKIVVVMVIFVISLALFNTIAYQIWSAKVERRSWYLTWAKVPFGQILFSFIIMFNTMIPLSLYVSMEIIKVGQMLLLNDIDMYDEASNTPFEARTSTINEELGQVSYVFSDKTGTLTENVMRFRKLSVAGTAWLHNADLPNQSEEGMLLHKKRKAKGKGKQPLQGPVRKSASNTTLASEGGNSLIGGSKEGEERPRKSMATWRSTAATNFGQPEMSTYDMIRYIQRRPLTAFAQKAKMMVLSMALCHTCLPEHGQTEDEINYQASSPDELALVQAATELGYIAFHRDASALTLKLYPDGLELGPVFEKYEVLDVIEFSSKRKRMSVVTRFPDGRICVICKGADSMVMERLRLAALAHQKVNEIEQRVDQRRSMEAQEALRRKSSTVDRQGSVGSYPRTSMSTARLPRPSIGRLAPIRDEVDGWLNEREQDIMTASPVDTSHYSPRPSAQLPRQSTGVSEHRSSLQAEREDEMLVEEALVLDDAAVIERCFQHINDFATEGLRTLLYAHRFLDEEEYRSWKKMYQDATTSLVNRQVMIEQAGELIEQQLELGGATAIEDKLQKGVPETIDRLRRANIKLWMLTGDKRETAINIGHSCRLIKDYSAVTVLDYEAGGVEQSIAAAIVDINRGGVAHSVIIIDGRTLGMIQQEQQQSLHTLFLDLAIIADSVICCRASPSQKASLVKAIRRRVAHSVTLAIGDGGNDIAMIQEAHVGIGITGKEGLQAARASDYSIAQFRFLTKLLLVHGRWNYIRTCKYILGTFWKEFLFYLTQALYQHFNGYTGTSLYEQWSLSMFNTLFTSLPVIFLGIFEKDLSAATLIAVPELYSKGQRSTGFNFRVYLSWIFMASTEAVIIFFTMRGLFGQGATFISGRDLYSFGTMTFTACVALINVKLQVLEQRYKSYLALICLFIEIGGWFLWDIALSSFYQHNGEYAVRHGILTHWGRSPTWWLTLLVSFTSCVLFELVVRAIKNAVAPTDAEVFQELERDIAVRRRFEEASASELQAGWHHGSKKSSLELQREAEMQAKREGEVQDLLDRPRVMEEGRGSGGAGKRLDGQEHTVATSPVEEDRPGRRSVEMQEMLSRRFGKIRRESLARPDMER